MESYLRYLTQDCHPIVYKFYCFLSYVLSMDIYFSLSFCIEKEFFLLTINFFPPFVKTPRVANDDDFKDQTSMMDV